MRLPTATKTKNAMRTNGNCREMFALISDSIKPVEIANANEFR